MHDLIQEMGHYIVRGENPHDPEDHSRVWQREDVVSICAMDATTVNDRIEALSLISNNHPHSLPQVVASMKKLRWFSCLDYPATSLPRNFQPRKLCYLQLTLTLKLRHLWEGYKHLPNLKVLDLESITIHASGKRH
ncbi:hypothetical protein L6452_13187 [Arctium lappa]|uniref:Uncharacterized protein n=1 Tax=Arctium lappa TaxID=4217 RepID=A0ACB9CHE9_ARCLA|nr:hypothetical protein L6452_13187 [Arctium lappa]